MRTECKEAAELAVSCHKKKRSSCIVVPDTSYSQAIKDLGKTPPGIFVRYANQRQTLMSIRVDTLITVKGSTFPPEILDLCKQMLRCGREPIWKDVDTILEIREGFSEILK